MTLQGMTRASISRDVATGFALWAVLVPSAFAYATIAGVPPVVGLYAIPVAVGLYAVAGSSRHLVVAPMATGAALSAAAVAGLSADPATAIALTAALAGVAGVLALLAGAARLGFLATFISEPVLKGFIIGLALTIIAGQAPQLFGLSAGHGSFFEMVWESVRDLGDAHATSLLVGFGSLVALLGLRRLVPRAPAPLIVAVAAVVAGKVFALADHGVAVVGQIPAGLPAVGLPDVAWSDYLSLSGAAVGIVIVGFAEGYGAAKTYAAKASKELGGSFE